MTKTQRILRDYFHRYTTLNPVQMHDLTEDEKRLQSEIKNRDIKLRFNRREGFCQVWHDSPDRGLYVVFNIKDKYGLCWAIRELKDRQRNWRQLRDMCLSIIEKDEQDFDYKNKQLSRETAELIRDHAVGKVVTSAR